MAMIYIFDMILSADNFDTILQGHAGFYQRSYMVETYELFHPKKATFSLMVSFLNFTGFNIQRKE